MRRVNADFGGAAAPIARKGTATGLYGTKTVYSTRPSPLIAIQIKAMRLA